MGHREARKGGKEGNDKNYPLVGMFLDVLKETKWGTESREACR